jgi:succinate-acetate transporter protein
LAGEEEIQSVRRLGPPFIEVLLTSEALAAICGSMYMFGGIALVLAGIFEFILGNTFPMAVFIIFGAHWVQTGFANDPNMGLAASYKSTGGAASLLYNSGGAFYNVTMALICFIFLIGSLRTNFFFVLVFFTLIPLFSLLAAGNWYIGYNPTPAGIEFAFHLFQIAGGFGFITALCGW